MEVIGVKGNDMILAWEFLRVIETAFETDDNEVKALRVLCKSMHGPKVEWKHEEGNM